MKTQSLRTKFLVVALGLVILLGLGVIVLTRSALTDMLEAQLEKRGLFIASSFAEEAVTPILTENALSLQMLCLDHKTAENDIEYLFVVNSKGDVLAHTFGETFPVGLREANVLNAGRPYGIRPLHTEKGNLFDIAAPILKGDLGTVHVGISAEPIRKGVAGIIKYIIWIIIGVLAFGSVIAIFFTLRITRPLAEFAKAAKTVGSGDLRNRLAVGTRDELGQLAAAFNKMVDDLLSTTVSRVQLERLVEERTTEITETHAKLQALIQAIPDAVFFKDTSGRYLIVNKAFEEMIGATHEMFMGKTDEDFMPRDIAEGCRRSDEALMKSGRPIFVEDLLIGRDGEKRFLDSVKAPIYGSDSGLLGIVGVSRDVTERKRAGEALNASNQQFMNLFENSPVSLWLEDFSAVRSYLDEVRQKGGHDLRSYFEKHPEEVAACAARLKVLDVNKSTLELYKAGSKEELLSGLDDTFTKESFDVFREGLIAIGEGKSKFEQESVTQTLTGERRDVIVKWSVIPGSNKSSSTMVVSIIDLTGHKRAAETIELLSRRNEMILKSAGEGICGIDLDGIMTFANPAAARMTGWNIDELIGKSQHDVLHHSFRDGVPHRREDCRIYASMKDGDVHRVSDEVFWRKDGTSFPVEYVSTPLYERDKIAGAVIVFNDISERRQIEEAVLSKDERLSRAQEIAHVGDWEWDLATNAVHWSDELYRIYGYAPRELSPDYTLVVNAMHPDSREVFLKAIDAALKGQGPFEMDYLFYRKDGSTAILHTIGKVSCDADGNPVRMLGIVQDITEQKKAQEALHKTNETLNALIRYSPLAVICIDADSNVMIWNPAAERIFGWREDEVLGRKNPIVPEEKEEEYLRLSESVRQGEPYLARELVRKKKDGSLIHLDAASAAIRDAEGRTVASFGLFQDITVRHKIEEALRKSEANYRSLLEQASDGIAVIDRQGRYLDVNSRMCDMLGYSRDEFLSLTITDIVAPGEISTTSPSRLSELLVGKTVLSERLMRRKDGSTFPMEISAKMIPDGRLCGIHRNISERKQAERLLNESEQKYRNLVELTSDIIYLSDKAGNQTYMNDAAYKVLGYAPEEVIQRPWSNLLHPNDREITFKIFSEMLERKTDVFNFENRYLTKAGRAINVLHNVRILRDERGEIIGTQGIARDITGRKSAEDNLKLFSKAIDEATDGVLIVDLDGYIVYSNRALEIMYGYGPGGMTSTHLDELSTEQEHSRRVIFPSIKETGHWSGEVRNVRKDGGVFSVWLSASLVKNDKGGPFAMVGIIRDITERKRVEEALLRSHEELEVLVRERTAELSMLNSQLRGLSVYLQEAREQERTTIAREIHDELGQSLTAMKMDLSILNKRLPKDQKAVMEKAKSMAELIEATIQSVKRISTELRPGVLDHLGLTAAIEWQAGEFEKRTGVLCDVAFEPEELVLDRHRSTTIFRVFQETLTNITRHADATNVSVRLKKRNNKLLLQVKDDGKGITEKQLADPKSLGLIGIRERVHYWGGSLTIRGSRNKGTTVAVRIPLDDTGEAL